MVSAKDSSKKQVYLAGFTDLSLQEIRDLHACVRSWGEGYLEVPVEAVISALEWRLGLTLNEVAALLLRLAAADREGRFDAEYQALMAHGLDRVVRLFTDMLLTVTPEQSQRVARFIRAVAQRFAQDVERQGGVHPQGLSGPIVGVIVTWAAERVLDYLFNALVSFLRGDRNFAIVRYFIKGGYFQIDGSSFHELTAHWENLRPWLEKEIEDPRNHPLPKRYFRNASGELVLVETHWTWKAFINGFIAGLGIDEYRSNIAVYTVAVYHHRFKYGPLTSRQSLSHLLELACFLGTIEQNPSSGQAWRAVGAIAEGPTTTHLVLVREEVRSNALNRNVRVRDVAVVNLTPVPETPDGYEKIFKWIETAVSRFREEEDLPNRPRVPTPWFASKGPTCGLDIAAVVFTRSASADEAREIRKLVDKVNEAIPFSYSYNDHDYTADDELMLTDLAARAVFFVWREADLVWFACIELGPGRLSEEERRRLALAWAGEAVAPHQIREYRPGSANTSGPVRSQTISGSASPVVIGGGGFEIPTIHMMWAVP